MPEQVTHAARQAKRDEVESLVRRLADACREEVAMNARLCLEQALGDTEQLPIELTKGEKK